MFDFEKFPVYIKSEKSYTKILKIISHPTIDRTIKDQLRRASLSIVLNIAEGAGKYTKRDKKNFYVIAKGSVNECVACLRILRIENIVTESEFFDAYGELSEIAKMLSGLINCMTEKKN